MTRSYAKWMVAVCAPLLAIAAAGCGSSDCPPGSNPDSVFCHQSSDDAGADSGPADAGATDLGAMDLGATDGGRMCTGRPDCPPGEACIGGFCAPCTSRADCGGTDACIDGVCGPCVTRADCDPGEACTDGACGPCATTADCDGDACVDGVCAPCTTSAECPPGEVCIAGACGPCDTSADCTGTDICVAGVCGPCVPGAETCNGADEDCDGVIDNGVPPGAACTAGMGACEASGTLTCVAGTYSVCGAVPASPSAEACNGIDDDCDGAVDNGVPGGGSCSAGVGACAVAGTLTCAAGTYSACSAVAGTPGAETCNGIDDDCDGTVDDGVPVGGACTAGAGTCARTGTLSCAAGSYSVCSAVAGTPGVETCNGMDDNCDGTVDNGVPLGAACSAGVGACMTTGTMLCVGGTYSTCSAVAGSPTASEICNGLDDNCDGSVDNGVPAGGACTAGTGTCLRSGTLSCAAGSYSVCSAVAGAPGTEACNGLDDDCDGTVDDGVPAGAACNVGTGGCRRTGTQICSGGTYGGCSAVAGSPVAETCNGVDDNCDGTTDNGVPIGGACTAGTGACLRSGTLSCAGGTYSVCGAVPGMPGTETCNGVDDNCDGSIDNGGVCNCTLPWGGTVANGAPVTGWSSLNAYYPGTCASATVTCTNGVLPLGGFNQPSCTQNCATYTGDPVVCNMGSTSSTGQYIFHNEWCVTPSCVPGSNLYNRGSALASMVCTNDFGNGSCTDDADEYLVTCSPFNVDGTWSCNGINCNPTYYGDAACTGHW